MRDILVKDIWKRWNAFESRKETFLYLSVSETLAGGGQKLEYLTCFFYISSYRETNIPKKKTIFVYSKSQK